MIAAGHVAGAPAKGRLWRHDPAERPSGFGDALVSCTGSLEIVNLPRPGEQLEIDLSLEPDADELEPDPQLETIALF
ncbi:hypothetical protein [Streptomyces sp. TE5632]